jgi:lysozyme
MLLRYGDNGQIVADLQRVLRVKADGEIGPKTAAACRAFQAAQGLPVGPIDMRTLAAAGVDPLPGIDVSHWQGKIDWRKVAAAGVRFVFVKASQDETSTDKTFAGNVRGAAGAGLPVGAYHFAWPETHDDPDDEAAGFLRAVEPVGDLLTLPAVLDLEANPGNLSPKALEQWALTWCEAVRTATGRMPLLYSGAGKAGSFVNVRLDGGKALAAAGVRLWTARYRGAGAVDPGAALGAWKRWAIWQWTGHGRVDGIVGDVDRNWLAGGQAALDALLQG